MINSFFLKKHDYNTFFLIFFCQNVESLAKKAQSGKRACEISLHSPTFSMWLLWGYCIITFQRSAHIGEGMAGEHATFRKYPLPILLRAFGMPSRCVLDTSIT